MDSPSNKKKICYPTPRKYIFPFPVQPVKKICTFLLSVSFPSFSVSRYDQGLGRTIDVDKHTRNEWNAPFSENPTALCALCKIEIEPRQRLQPNLSLKKRKLRESVASEF
jgi:hypothetical protein